MPVESYVSPNCQWNANVVSALGTRSITSGTHPSTSRVRAPISAVDSVPRGNSHSAVAAGKPHGQLLCCVTRKETKAALAKQAPKRGRNGVAKGEPAAPKTGRAGTCAEETDLCDD